MAITKKKKKIIIITSIVIVALILIVFLIAPFIIASVVYEGVFMQRYETAEHLRFGLEDFDGLTADRYEFKSDKGQTLVGYRYYMSDNDARGVVVIAHGFGGGGHNSYMDVAYCFAQNGYDVFAYDATGNDESGGDGTYGLPQGVIDLSYAIDYLDEIDELKDLPVMLWGHSWGAYSVSAVLEYHPEIKAVAAIAGFNRSSDLLKAQGAEMIGKGAINFLMPYVNCIEKIKFGNYASATAVNGFDHSSAGVLIAHSNNDTVVPVEYGYDIYKKRYSDNSRFTFVTNDYKGHNDIIYSDEYIDYIADFNRQLDGLQDATYDDKVAYIKDNLDRAIYCDGLDKELFNTILDLYNSNL